MARPRKTPAEKPKTIIKDTTPINESKTIIKDTMSNEDLLDAKQLLKELNNLKEEMIKIQSMPNGTNKHKDKKIIRDDRNEDGGWIIFTSNKEYTGATLGVQIIKGIGIVDASMDDSDYIVTKLEKDFGYVVKPGTAEQINNARKQISANIQITEEKPFIDNITTPTTFNG